MVLEEDDSPFPTAREMKIFRMVEKFSGVCHAHKIADCRTCKSEEPVGSRTLYEVVVTSELKNPETGEMIPGRHVIHVWTDDPLLKAGQKALDELAGYESKVIHSIKSVGDFLVIA